MLGFDIGGTKCAVILGEEKDGEIVILDKKKIETDHSVSAYEMIDRMCALAESMTDDFSKIGISCGGPLDSKKGVILSPPNLPGWDNVEIVDYLEKRYGGKVLIQNDANACAVAEWKYGAGKGTQNMVFLTFGTGLGAGLIIDGKLYSGTNDMAGEVGHIRLADSGPVGFGKKGSFEGFCSGGGIAQLGKIMATEKLDAGLTTSYCKSKEDLGNITAKSIAESAYQGNDDAKEVYRVCGEKLGEGISILIDTLNPEVIVIGSIFERCEDLLRDEMEKKIKEEAISYSSDICKIVPAKLAENIGDIASLSVASMIDTDKDMLKDLLKRYPKLIECEEQIKDALELIRDTYKKGGKVLVCGNGGSASDSEHIVGELMKGFKKMRKVTDERIPEDLRRGLQGALPAISLPSQSGILTAFINDVDPEMMYAQLVYGYAKENDLLIGLSTSGNSKNVVNAVRVAKAVGAKALALTGKNESKLSELCDVCIKVPETETFKIQELHLPVYHYLCAQIEEDMF